MGGIFSSKNSDSYNKSYIKNHSNYALILDVYRDYYSEDAKKNSVIKSIVNLLINEFVKNFIFPYYEQDQNEENMNHIKTNLKKININFKALISNSKTELNKSSLKFAKNNIIKNIPTVATPEEIPELATLNINTLIEVLEAIQIEISNLETIVKSEKDDLDTLNWFQRRFVNVSWRKENYDKFKNELDVLSLDVKLKKTEINGAQTQFNIMLRRIDSDIELATKYSNVTTRINLLFPEYRIKGNESNAE